MVLLRVRLHHGEVVLVHQRPVVIRFSVFLGTFRRRVKKVTHLSHGGPPSGSDSGVANAASPTPRVRKEPWIDLMGGSKLDITSSLSTTTISR